MWKGYRRMQLSRRIALSRSVNRCSPQSFSVSVSSHNYTYSNNNNNNNNSSFGSLTFSTATQHHTRHQHQQSQERQHHHRPKKHSGRVAGAHHHRHLRVPTHLSADTPRECHASTHWLLSKTASWNTSHLHWREARHLMQWWMSTAKKSSTNTNTDFAANQTISHTRVLLQLLERGLDEWQTQQQSPDDLQQQRIWFVSNHARFPLFWEDPPVVVRLITDVWKYEWRQQQRQQQHFATTAEADEDDIQEEQGETDHGYYNANDNRIQQQQQQQQQSPSLSTSPLGATTVPTLEEMQEWIAVYGPSLPESATTMWKQCLQESQQPQMKQQQKHQPRDSVPMVRFLSKLERDEDGFRDILGVNKVLANLKSPHAERYLDILPLLWQKPPHLHPTHDTYFKIMQHVQATRVQHGVYYKNTGQFRPQVGTGRLLWDLYRDLWHQHEEWDVRDGVTTQTLRPAFKHLLLVLDTMVQEESGGYGRDAWELWEDNLRRRHEARVHIPPHASFAQLVLQLWACSDEPEVPQWAQSLIQALEQEERLALERRTQRKAEQAKEKQVKENQATSTETPKPLKPVKTPFNPWLAPTRKFWLNYLACLTQSRDPNDLQTAQELLTQPMVTQEDGTIYADNQMYGLVLRAWARADMPDRAQALFDSMLSSSSSVKPDTKTVLDAVVAWADAPGLSLPEKSARISDILSKVAQQSKVASNSDDSRSDIEDDEATLISVSSSLLRMLSTAQDEDKDGVRAEIIFKTLFHQQDVDPAFALSMEDYCAVITALSRAKTPTPQRAESILLELIRRSDDDPENESLQPPENAFTSTIVCWGRSSEEHAVIRAQNIFDLMLNRYRKGQSKLRPSTHSYTAVINAWARAGKASRAEFVLNQMLNDYQDQGNEAARPDATAFNSVLAAWEMAARRQHQSKTPSAAAGTVDIYAGKESEPYDRACAVLELMTELIRSQVLPITFDCKPFGAVISTLIPLQRNDKDELARFHLRQAQELYEGGNKACQPDSYTLGAVIQVLKSLFDKDSHQTFSKEHALEMEDYLRDILRLREFDGRQILFAHDAVLQAWMKLSPQYPPAVDHVDDILEGLLELSDSRQGPLGGTHDRGTDRQHVAPNSYILFKVLKTYTKSHALDLHERTKRAQRVREIMIRYNIPMDSNLAQLFRECHVSVD